eukprot:g2512.t1
MASCESEFVVTGLFNGEELLSVVRTATTLTSISVASAWFSRENIAKLSLFFAHWLAGLVAGLGFLVEDEMVTICWTGSNLEGFIKALKFIELSAFNMFAVTNLAICVNLALIVSSYRTVSRARSLSAPPLLLAFLAISMGLATPLLLLGERTLVTGTNFYLLNREKRGNDIMQIFYFAVEFFVGICMLIIVTWLLLFRLNEIKECWKIHPRIRFYFGLTLVGTAVNLSIGVCGMINVLSEELIILLISWSWGFRCIHVALDTFVLYGVLRETKIDERGCDNIVGSGSGDSNPPSGRRRPKCGMHGGSGTSDTTNKRESGVYPGEEALTVVRVVTTLVSVTVTSAWFSWKKITRLSLFFAHWLAGLVAALGFLVEDMMISVCWTGSNLLGFIKALKFIELAAFNMFAVTNLAVCVNLALIVSSHRTLSRVRSVSTPPLLLAFLLISVVLAIPVSALAEGTIVTATAFYTINSNKESDNVVMHISYFYVEFLVGVCMFFIVTWLLMSRLKEIKECWKIHPRIRFYFGLTLVGIAVNLGIGICGTVNVLLPETNRTSALLFVSSWGFRYVHVALDTVVLYGVLREKNMDERGDGDSAGSGVSALPSGRKRDMPRASGAGLVAGLGHLVEDMMVSVCWTGSNLLGFIKALKFIELSAFNMFAVTNLAICINLALVVSRGNKLILVLFFYVEFFVGICMFIVVAWLLLFRLKEIKECWKIHARIRFYFGLTLVGIAVNLGLGISGAANVLSDDLSWTKIKKLSLFFAHWLAGLLAGLGHLVEDMMVTVCWTGSDLVGFIKALKLIELSAFNMFAVTNLAICINLALIISSHRTMSRVKSVSTPSLLLVFLVISMGLAAPVIALGDKTLISGTGFYVINNDVKGNDFIQISFFYVEFFVGICMLIIVAWLLLFRMEEIKECWRIHARIRFYFGLTLVGIAVNLCIGICGLVNTLSDGFNAPLIVWSWVFRYVHVALDTIVLYGVLRKRNMDERGDENMTNDSSLSSVRRTSNPRDLHKGSGTSNNASKPVAVTPLA